MTKQYLGLLGGRSFVGSALISSSKSSHYEIISFSRKKVTSSLPNVQWRELKRPVPFQIKNWISFIPLWALPDYFELLEKQGVSRIVVLSSTSRFTKQNSSDIKEKIFVQKLADAETTLENWANSKKIEWIILRPTLIYGLGLDQNIYVIARFIQRFGFFPLLGQGKGLRQPLHVADLAQACLDILEKTSLSNRAYNLSGNEIISYHEMINRLFIALGRRPRIYSIPCALFRLVINCLHWILSYKKFSIAMVERMNQDLIFDHEQAKIDFGFQARKFILSDKDLPKTS